MSYIIDNEYKSILLIVGQYPHEDQEDFYERKIKEREREWVCLFSSPSFSHSLFVCIIINQIWDNNKQVWAPKYL